MNFEHIIQGSAMVLLGMVLLHGGRGLARIGNKVADGVIDAFKGLKEAQTALLESQRAQNIDDVRRDALARELAMELARVNRHKMATDLTTVQANLLHAISEVRRDVIEEFRREREVDLSTPLLVPKPIKEET